MIIPYACSQKYWFQITWKLFRRLLKPLGVFRCFGGSQPGTSVNYTGRPGDGRDYNFLWGRRVPACGMGRNALTRPIDQMSRSRRPLPLPRVVGLGLSREKVDEETAGNAFLYPLQGDDAKDVRRWGKTAWGGREKMSVQLCACLWDSIFSFSPSYGTKLDLGHGPTSLAYGQPLKVSKYKQSSFSYRERPNSIYIVSCHFHISHYHFTSITLFLNLFPLFLLIHTVQDCKSKFTIIRTIFRL